MDKNKKKNTQNKAPGSKNKKNSSKARVIRLNLNPLVLLTVGFFLFFLVAGVVNQVGNSTVQQVSVSEFVQGIKQNQYSGVDIQDDGRILAQDKYVLTANITNDEQIKITDSTKGVSEDEGLEQIELSQLVEELKPADPLEQLRSLVNAGEPSQAISEIIIADNFILAGKQNKQVDNLIVRNANEEDLRTALDAEGLILENLQVTVTDLSNTAKQTQYEVIQSKAEQGTFSSIYEVNDVVYARVATNNIPTYSIRWDGGIDAFASTLQEEGISLANENVRIGTIITQTIPWGTITSVLTLVLLLILGFFLFRSIQNSGSSLMRFGQSKAKMFFGVKPDVTFDDVAGIDEAKNELQEIVQFLKSPEKFRKLGARIPKGALMVGKPGTGKTLLARAIAGEAGVPFFHTSGSEFEEMLVGAGASRVRDLFDKAKKSAPALIFIDEIDAVARKRGTTIQSSTTEQTLNQILVEMDGFETGTNVIVVAATNRPDVLDPAILRPGRFDRRIMLDLPDIEGRKQILAVHAKNKPFAKEVDMESVAKRTIGFSGADLENTLNEAAIIAAKDNRKEITFVDIEEAASKVTMGPVKKSKRRTQDEIELVAVHETGHAFVSRYTPKSDNVHRVSILSRGMAGGVTHFLPQDDETIVSRSRLLARLRVMLGGRAAEEVILDEISTGASNDISQATNIARNMIQKWGMSEKLGLIKYGQSDELEHLGYSYNDNQDYSDETAKIIDEEVRNLVDTAYAEAKDIIAQDQERFKGIVAELKEKEVLEANEFEEFFTDLDDHQQHKEDAQATTGNQEQDKA